MAETIQVFVRKCIKCGSLFETEKRCLRICQKCRNETVSKPKKICVDCGKEFQSSSKLRCHDCLAKLKPSGEKKKVCLWCRNEFTTNKPFQKFCCSECREQFSSMSEKMDKRHFELNTSVEYAKLEELGSKYELPERKKELEESEENQEL